jgi:hypothetical protein
MAVQGVTIKELAWWLVAQVEMDHNARTFSNDDYGKTMQRKVLPFRAIKWATQELNRKVCV